MRTTSGRRSGRDQGDASQLTAKAKDKDTQSARASGAGTASVRVAGNARLPPPAKGASASAQQRRRAKRRRPQDGSQRNVMAKRSSSSMDGARAMRYFARYLVVSLLLQQPRRSLDMLLAAMQALVARGVVGAKDPQREWEVTCREGSAFVRAVYALQIVVPTTATPVAHASTTTPASLPPDHMSPSLRLPLNEGRHRLSAGEGLKFGDAVLAVGGLRQVGLRMAAPAGPGVPLDCDCSCPPLGTDQPGCLLLIFHFSFLFFLCTQAKFSELNLDLFRMALTLEYAPATTSGASSLPSAQREPPHKYLLYKPTCRQLLAVLAAAQMVGLFFFCPFRGCQ